MSKLTYAQLEGLWIQAGGEKALAPLMAAIALAESGGRSEALNPTDNGGKQSSYGLWQISTGTHTAPSPTWSNPLTNAQLAVGKYKSQGLKAWGTYTSGAYKPFLANGVPATPYISGSTSTTVNQVGDTASSDNSCAWSVGLPVVGQTCIVSKTNVRVLLGLICVSVGIGVGLIGAVLLVTMGLNQPVPQKLARMGGAIS